MTQEMIEERGMTETKGAQKRGLGRGLSALLGDDDVLDTIDSPEIVPVGLQTLPIGALFPNPDQPRHRFDEVGLSDLAASIKAKGVLTPILVRKDPAGSEGYQIIAGERRWRAAQRAQLHDVPVVVRDMSDRETLEVALVENLQRQDLSPIEEAQGYRRLMDEFAHTQEDLAEALGKSRSHIANMMRLTTLPDDVKDLIEDGQLTAGHARALITAQDPLSLAHQVISQGLNVRQTEQLVQSASSPKSKKSRSGSTSSRGAGSEKDADTLALERDVSNALGMDVSIDNRDRGGVVMISYETLAQLDEILRRLSSGVRTENEIKGA